ncbi:hypothetical protein [Bosea sp. TND4EK4]|uniref:hypothetical protein n=1 Tax=Bosea sp. TND4EK4 TaxID=1907408 RepID=UPI0009574E58|nr:hypothetical protein [Bosea sp. TND4EK4]SIR42133.1 hypothetical protein SAMN05880592_12040 [Bosea sp. TND4EK4]
MQSYEIVVRVRMDAEDPRDAALRAFGLMTASTPFRFEVRDEAGLVQEFSLDLDEQDEAIALDCGRNSDGVMEGRPKGTLSA